MLKIPTGPPSIAETVAVAASSTWTKEKTPEPLAAIGN